MLFSKNPENVNKFFWPSLLLFLVGAHSILLGLTIIFFTEFFYNVFFAVNIENIFFVRQSGIFLFLIGFFYLYPLLSLKENYSLILLTVVSKAVAVLFLITNAKLTSAPAMIYLAAFFDGLMGAVLTIVYVQCRKTCLLQAPSIAPADESIAKEIA
jgi:hypothetical protein